jgi:hypothetical protein
MSEQTDERNEPTPDVAETENAAPVPMLRCSGEGYITRKDGTIVPFTFQGEG